MDRQLACATFATLIPVLLIAGFLVDQATAHMSARYRRWFLYGVTVVATCGELASVDGVAEPHPAAWIVYPGEAACVCLAVGVAMVIVARAREYKE